MIYPQVGAVPDARTDKIRRCANALPETTGSVRVSADRPSDGKASRVIPSALTTESAAVWDDVRNKIFPRLQKYYRHFESAPGYKNIADFLHIAITVCYTSEPLDTYQYNL